MEEIKKIREDSIFKATPIRKFKPISSVVTEKVLTVPVAPKLSTASRASLRDDLIDTMDITE